MQYRRIGKSGLKVSEVALGAWLTYGGSVAEERAAPIIQAALDLGVNFLDLADIYSKGRAEEIVGRAIRGRNRSDLVISSKVFWPMSENINDRGLGRKHVMESVEKSLKRIGTDYLDIYFCHRFDPDITVEEVVRTMDDLVHQGKILYWGTSIWTATQIERAISEARSWRAYAPIVEQPPYNMFHRRIERDIISACRHHGMGLTVFSPLAQGLLTGKYNDGLPPGSRGEQTAWLENDLTPGNVAKTRQLARVARSVDLTLAQLALAWILRHEQVSCAIIGATDVAHVEENIVASGITLAAPTLEAIDRILDDNDNPA